MLHSISKTRSPAVDSTKRSILDLRPEVREIVYGCLFEYLNIFFIIGEKNYMDTLALCLKEQEGEEKRRESFVGMVVTETWLSMLQSV